MAQQRCSIQLRNIAKSLTDGKWLCAIKRMFPWCSSIKHGAYCAEVRRVAASLSHGEDCRSQPRRSHDEVLSKLWSANEFVLARDKLLRPRHRSGRRQSAFQGKHLLAAT